MAKKKSEEAVRITYTEILTLAIKQLTAEIEPYRQKLDATDKSDCKDMLRFVIAPLVAKRAILADYYRNETGIDYGLDEIEV